MKTPRFKVIEAVSKERSYQDNFNLVNNISDDKKSISDFLLELDVKLQDTKNSLVKESNYNAMCGLLQLVSIGISALENLGVCERSDYQHEYMQKLADYKKNPDECKDQKLDLEQGTDN